MELPRIISVDDHVMEPPDLWDRLPKTLRDSGPQCRREKGVFDNGGLEKFNVNVSRWVAGADLPGASWCDVWYYEDMVTPMYRAMANAGHTDEDLSRPIVYDEMLPAAYQREPRLALMAEHHTDASICFPNVCRFCGQMFAERHDKDVALAALQVYNDWMIDEWCAGSGPTRLIPLTLIPLWDPELGAAEVRRCAEKGAHAIAFSECPPELGLPSVYSAHWDPLFAACQETDTVINMHVGSSSKVTMTASDAPTDVTLCLLYINSMLAFTDWLYSGTLQRFPDLKVALSESQVGWIPFAAERVDNTWIKANEKFRAMKSTSRRATELPSSVIPGRVFGCVFDDVEGLRNRDTVGMDQILFETDFPHTDSTFPHSKEVAEKMCADAGLNDEEVYKLVRGNAIKAYGLDKYFGIDR